MTEQTSQWAQRTEKAIAGNDIVGRQNWGDSIHDDTNAVHWNAVKEVIADQAINRHLSQITFLPDASLSFHSMGSKKIKPESSNSQTAKADVTSPHHNSGSEHPALLPGSDTLPSVAGGMGGRPAPGDGNGFQISNGQLLVNGKLLNGVSVSGQYAEKVGPETLANEISSRFPGINVVRLGTSPEGGAITNGVRPQGGETVQNIDQTIRALNAKGIAVIVDNHGSDAFTPNNVSQDGGEAAWFAQIAKDNLGNKMVMFQPANEPTGSDADIVSEQQAAYDAIRTTCSNSIVAFDLAYTNAIATARVNGSASPMESDPSAYDRDSNYVIDAHAYALNSTDPAKQLQEELAETSNLTEANGSPVPVYVGETGIAADGVHVDPQATQELNTVFSDGTGGIAGLYNGAIIGREDSLCNGDGTLNSFGQEVAALIRKGAH